MKAVLHLVRANIQSSVIGQLHTPPPERQLLFEPVGSQANINTGFSEPHASVPVSSTAGLGLRCRFNKLVAMLKPPPQKTCRNASAVNDGG